MVRSGIPDLWSGLARHPAFVKMNSVAHQTTGNQGLGPLLRNTFSDCPPQSGGGGPPCPRSQPETDNPVQLKHLSGLICLELSDLCKHSGRVIRAGLSGTPPIDPPCTICSLARIGTTDPRAQRTIRLGSGGSEGMVSLNWLNVQLIRVEWGFRTRGCLHPTIPVRNRRTRP
jgi:hypothetical protein